MVMPWTHEWSDDLMKQIFGKLLCHLLPFAQGVSVYISAFTLMSIAIDRFFVIIYPFKARMQIKVCLFIVVCVWLFAGVLTFPYGYFMEIVPYNTTVKNLDGDWVINNYCEEAWIKPESRTAFAFSTTILQFVVPFIIIAFCYINVSCKLRERARCKPGAKSARKEELERERTRRTNRMLIAMVMIFGVSWLPLNLYNLVIDLIEGAHDYPWSRTLFFLSHAAAMSSTCYNPFLYAWLNENFRKEFKQVLPCFKNNRRNSSKTYYKHSNYRPEQSQIKGRGGRAGSDDIDGEIMMMDHPECNECNGNHESIQLQEQSIAINNKQQQQHNNKSSLYDNHIKTSIESSRARQSSIPEETDEEEEEEEETTHEPREEEDDRKGSDLTAITVPSSSVSISSSVRLGSSSSGTGKKDAAVYVRSDSFGGKKPPVLTSREPSAAEKKEPVSTTPSTSTSSSKMKDMGTMTSFVVSSSKSTASIYVASKDSVKSKITTSMAEESL